MSDPRVFVRTSKRPVRTARSRLSSITGSGSRLLDADVFDLLLGVSHTLRQDCLGGRISAILQGLNGDKCSNVLVDIGTPRGCLW
jgi:hypothetical protein